MLNKIAKTVSGIVIGTVVSSTVVLSTANAAAADRGKEGIEGTVSCGGSYFLRNNGTEIQRSTYVVRNLNNEGVIALDRVRLYNASGTMLFDSDTSGIPTSYNGVLNPAHTVLDAHQTADLRLQDIISTQGRSARPFQFVIDWHADEPLLTLDVTHVRTSNDYDPATGAIGKQSGRAHSACRTIRLVKKSRW